MNLKEFSKDYCPGFNWVNRNHDHKVYCNPLCPNFIGLSKQNINKILKLKPLCEIEETKAYIKYNEEK